MGPVKPEDLMMLMVSPCNSSLRPRKKRTEKNYEEALGFPRKRLDLGVRL